MVSMSQPETPDPYKTAEAQTEASSETAQSNVWYQNVNQVTPYGTQTYKQTGWQPIYDSDGNISSYAPTYTSTIELSDTEQQLLDKNNQLRNQFSDIALDQAGRIANTYSTDWNANVSTPWVDYAQADAFRRDEAPTDRAAIEDAIMATYKRQTDPLYAAQNVQAIAMGMAPGSQGWGTMQQGQLDANTAAAQQAYLASGAESRAAQDAYNKAVQQEYDAATNWAANTNTLHQNKVTESLMERNQPLQEVLAMMGVSMPNTPTFSSYNPSSMSDTNIAQMIYDSYNAEMQKYTNSMSGMFNMGGDILGALPWTSWLGSDRRLKSHIRRIPGHLAGMPLYTFQYRKHVAIPPHLWGARRKGVMADEVRPFHPDAVMRHADGYDRVNYELLARRHIGYGQAAQ